jgi:hypothetical protein
MGMEVVERTFNVLSSNNFLSWLDGSEKYVFSPSVDLLYCFLIVPYLCCLERARCIKLMARFLEVLDSVDTKGDSMPMLSVKKETLLL